MKTVKLTLATAGEKKKQVSVKAHSFFNVYGQKFAVTRFLGTRWFRATHVETGFAVPDSESKNKKYVKGAAKRKINYYGKKMLIDAIIKAEMMVQP